MKNSTLMAAATSAEKYLSSHHILIYLEDAICQLLEQKVNVTGVRGKKWVSECVNERKQAKQS